MATTVEKSIMVNVPVSRAYNQWTQFEDFPEFMSGVKSVTQLSDDRLEWVAEIGGVQRKWEAKIVEQVPDRKVAWAAIEGATNAGAVTFQDVGGGQTKVVLSLEYEPEGLVEKVGDKLNVVEKQAESDLDRFKEFIESERFATGAWRGEVNPGAPTGTPGVESAAASRGDSGKAGVSGKAAAAGAGVAAAGAAAAAAAASSSSKDEEDELGVTPARPAATPATAAPIVPSPTDAEEGRRTAAREDAAAGVDPATDPAVDPLTDPDQTGRR